METFKLISMKDRLMQFARDYDPESDLIPKAPKITYIDMQLIDVCYELLLAIETMQQQIEKLDARLLKLEAREEHTDSYNDFMDKRSRWQDYLERKENE